jgi:hypothetical protein
LVDDEVGLLLVGGKGWTPRRKHNKQTTHPMLTMVPLRLRIMWGASARTMATAPK